MRADLTFAAAHFAVVSATVFLFALVPQAFDRLSAQSFEFFLSHADPLERDIEVSRGGRIRAALDGDTLAGVLAAGEAHERRLPSSLRAALGTRTASLEAVRHTIVSEPGESGPSGTVRFLTLRVLPDSQRRVRVRAGRLPRPAGVVDLPFSRQRRGPLLEVALTQTTAQQLSTRPGERLYLFPANDDPLVRTAPTSELRTIAVDVVGIVASDDRPWLRRSRLGRAAIRDTETSRFVYAYGLLAAESYGELLAAVSPLPLRYEWQYPVDPRRLAEQDAADLAAAARRIEAEFGQTTFGQTLGLGARTGLTRILDRYERDRDAAEAVLAVGAIALLAVAFSVLGMLAALAAERRVHAIELLRSRGASLSQTLAAQALEGLLMALPAGVLGFAASALAVKGEVGGLAPWLALAIVLATAVALAAAALGPARRALAARARDDVAILRLSPRRLALEAGVALAALAGAYLLRRRGLSGEAEGVDAYLAAVPVLVGLAVGLLVLRLYPLPLRALAGNAARGRELVRAMGLRRLARQSPVNAVPLLVVLFAVSVAVLAAAVAATIGSAQAATEPGRLSPLDTGAHRTFQAGIGVAGAYAALALVLASVLAAPPRVRDLTYLRALGLSRRDALGLAVAEIAAPAAAALFLGIALGLGVAYLLEPGFDLAELGAGQGRVGIRPDPVAPALLAAALLLVAGWVAALSAYAVGRADLSRALRLGER